MLSPNGNVSLLSKRLVSGGSHHASSTEPPPTTTAASIMTWTRVVAAVGNKASHKRGLKLDLIYEYVRPAVYNYQVYQSHRRTRDPVHAGFWTAKAPSGGRGGGRGEGGVGSSDCHTPRATITDRFNVHKSNYLRRYYVTFVETWAGNHALRGISGMQMRCVFVLLKFLE